MHHPKTWSYKHGGERGNQNEWSDERKRKYQAVRKGTCE